MSIDTYIHLPVETGNTGKKTAVVQKTQGADTVVLPRFVPDRAESVVAVFRVATLLTALLVAAQNGTSTAIAWFMNPTGSGRTIRIRRISNQYNFIGVTTLTTLPRIVAQRFINAGTPAGTQLLGVNVDGSDATTSIADIRTTNTGLTHALTANTILAADMPPMAQVSGTAAVFETSPTVRSEMIDADSSEDEWIRVPPGHGIAIYQADAGGATAETRKIVTNIVWDEVL
jgi:hypothetical protein